MASGTSARRTSSTRAKDSDRTATCQVLDTALSEGQLSMAEHGERVKSATNAATLGELQDLVSDLQTSRSPVELSTPARRRLPALRGDAQGWGIRAAMAAVLVVLGVAIGWGLYGNTPSPLNFTSDPGAKSDGIPAQVLTPPRQLHSLGGLTGLFGQMRQKFGDTRGYRLTIYPDYASLERPDPTEPRRALSYSYRGGWDDPTETSAGSDARVVDLGAFDIPKLVGILRGAPETLGINPAEVKTTYVSIDPNGDMTAPPDSIEISIYVSPTFGNSGYIELAGDGTIKRINYPNQ
ncbi:protein of unknown function (DUF1707) [Mycolicibacterium chubuense NBB4]|uniref:DUF1707 domain-containing protein n=1 Tax=Mycolicibacterium chubuense (strain NBB4) TaxID=710421 RepID=I4BRR2_MYCCN|nr:DUF1707 domain-containing protein [Mycolicibacterium chubuense]AFM19969.1 protein of unknown function (DUF1707) [Mycolicibacterium chubuense NBB4]